MPVHTHPAGFGHRSPPPAFEERAPVPLPPLADDGLKTLGKAEGGVVRQMMKRFDQPENTQPLQGLKSPRQRPLPFTQTHTPTSPTASRPRQTPTSRPLPLFTPIRTPGGMMLPPLVRNPNFTSMEGLKPLVEKGTIPQFGRGPVIAPIGGHDNPTTSTSSSSLIPLDSHQQQRRSRQKSVPSDPTNSLGPNVLPHTPHSFSGQGQSGGHYGRVKTTEEIEAVILRNQSGQKALNEGRTTIRKLLEAERVGKRRINRDL